jgi:hypothetical protein
MTSYSIAWSNDSLSITGLLTRQGQGEVKGKLKATNWLILTLVYLRQRLFASVNTANA